MTVVEPIDQVHITRAATPHTDGQRTGKMRLGAGGESGDFLVPNRNPLNNRLLADRFRKAVQRVTNDPVNAFNTCGDECFND
jgi:hypothetical protein